MKDGADDPAEAETEVRFKLRIPRRSIASGPAAIRDLAAATVGAFERILSSGDLARYVPAD